MNSEGGEWMSDLTDMKPELHERKWEIDSLCYPIRLAYHYWKNDGRCQYILRRMAYSHRQGSENV